MSRVRLLTFITLALLLAASCGRRQGDRASGGTPVPLRHARLLSLTNHDGYTEAVVRNPWDTLRTLTRYLLVPRNSALPTVLPEGTVVRVPLANSLVYSTVHSSLVAELGALDAIGGMCNANHVKEGELLHRLRSGRVADCGQDLNPDLERIVMLHPDAILLSPYQNNDRYGKVAALGVPVIECADYMEPHPLGRAEWMCFYGLLYGCPERADSIFADVERRYAEVRERGLAYDSSPTVLFDTPYGQSWLVPAGGSIPDILVKDAGGENPFAGIEGNGAVPVAPERVLATAHGADVWAVRYNTPGELTLQALKAESPLYGQFDALQRGRVYGCNTRTVPYYEETPFHPDRLLSDLQLMLHPDTTELLHYFKLLGP